MYKGAPKIDDESNTQRINLVRSWIKESGLKQQFICSRLNIWPSYLSAMIGKNPTRRMPIHLFNKISDILA